MITGASSGIGEGLALSHAAPGVFLYLGGRDRERLDGVAARCRQRGAVVDIRQIDVTSRQEMTDWVQHAGGARLDIVYVCAGITGGMAAPEQDKAAFESAAQVRRMLQVDLDGALNTILPSIDRMRSQSRDKKGFRGQICAIASVAGLVSYPGTPSYSAAKAALDRFMVATGAYTRRAGIYLTSVCCGFVDTPMVAGNTFPMPGLVSTEEAVRRIRLGVKRRKRRIIFPVWLVLGSRFMDMLPIRLAEAYYLRQPTGRPGAFPPVAD